MISLRRLIEGGAAILAAERRNHKNDSGGARVRRPLDKVILRVFVDS